MASLLDRVKRPPQSAESFIAAAESAVIAPTAAPIAAPELSPTQSTAPAEQTTPSVAKQAKPTTKNTREPVEDPRKFDVPRYTFNLRLNDYELELLRKLAKGRRESMQKIVKAGLVPYLESQQSKSTEE